MSEINKNYDFENFVVKANSDLDSLKIYINEKDQLIEKLSFESKKQFASEMRMHRDVRSKLEFLQVITSMLAKKNQELEEAMSLLKQKEANKTSLQKISLMYNHGFWL